MDPEINMTFRYEMSRIVRFTRRNVFDYLVESFSDRSVIFTKEMCSENRFDIKNWIQLDYNCLPMQFELR